MFERFGEEIERNRGDKISKSREEEVGNGRNDSRERRRGIQ